MSKLRLRTRVTRYLDKIVTFIFNPFLNAKTKRLVYRRDGFMAHRKLEKVFKGYRAYGKKYGKHE